MGYAWASFAFAVPLLVFCLERWLSFQDLTSPTSYLAESVGRKHSGRSSSCKDQANKRLALEMICSCSCTNIRAGPSLVELFKLRITSCFVGTFKAARGFEVYATDQICFLWGICKVRVRARHGRCHSPSCMISGLLRTSNVIARGPCATRTFRLV